VISTSRNGDGDLYKDGEDTIGIINKRSWGNIILGIVK